MNKLGLRLLKCSDFDCSKGLETLHKSNNIAVVSDYTICLGGKILKIDDAKGEEDLENRAGQYLLEDSELAIKEGKIFNTKTGVFDRINAELMNQKVIDYRGNFNIQYTANIGIRLTLPFSSIYNDCSNKEVNKDGILEVEFGEYPQQATSKDMQKILEESYLLESKALSKTGKKYTKVDNSMDQTSYDEYEYNGVKYIRMKLSSNQESVTLSNGEKYADDDYVWIKVQPIKWLVDKKNDTAISKNILLNIKCKIKDRYILNSYNGVEMIKAAFDNYLSAEIIPSKAYTQKDKITPSAQDISNCQLQQETRNPVIIENNTIHKTGINITIKLPADLKIDCIQIQESDNECIGITIQDSNDKQKQKVYRLR